MLHKGDDKEAVFDDILNEMIEEGRALREILKDPGTPSTSTFFEWIEKDEDKAKRYSRACELRADFYFDKIAHIAENTEEGKTTTVDHNGLKVVTEDMLGHRTLKIRTYQWLLGKMNPKKYGDKLDVTSGDKPIQTAPPIFGDNPLDRE